MTSLAIAADIRSQFGPVRNQGHRLTCLAFSTSAAHEHAHKMKDQLCVEWLFYHAVRGSTARASDGISIAEACATVEQHGQPDEKHWPYAKTLDLASWKLPASAPTKVWRGVAGPVDIPAIKGRLDAGRPVVIALSIGSGLVRGVGKELQNELVLEDDPEPVARGEGHAFVVVGHGVVEGSPYLLVRNSWGPKWGRDGHAWISVAEAQKRWMGGFELGEKS